MNRFKRFDRMYEIRTRCNDFRDVVIDKINYAIFIFIRAHGAA